jgi:hypothetical protein
MANILQSRELQKKTSPAAENKSHTSTPEISAFPSQRNKILQLQSTMGNQAVIQMLNNSKMLNSEITSPSSIHKIAAAGVQGTGHKLPYYDRIQASFGDHDLSNIQAYTDSAAAKANADMGAHAYATGNKIAFAGTPSLHTAAHEAAHVIQQRAGVHLKGGVGEVGDIYERNADAVADRVMCGASVNDLLSKNLSFESPRHDVSTKQYQPAVQRAVGFEFETGWLVEVGKKSMWGRGGEQRKSLKKTDLIENFGDYKIEADEAGDGKSELEFIIYPPLAETPDGLEKLKNTMTEILLFGQFLETKAQNLKDESEFILSINNNKYYIQPTKDKKLTGGPQVTTGLDLSKIPYLSDINSKDTVTAAPKELENTLMTLSHLKKFPKTMSPQLRGLFTIIATYIKTGLNQIVDIESRTKKNLWGTALSYPKQIADRLLARTQFSGLFKLLPKDEQEFYRKYPKEFAGMGIETIEFFINIGNGTNDFKLNKKDSIIERGVRENEDSNSNKIYKPKLTIYDWLLDIPKGIDQLRSIKDAESMGQFGDKTEEVGTKNNKVKAGIFEFRGAQASKLPLEKWSEFAIKFFNFIMTVHGHKPNHPENVSYKNSETEERSVYQNAELSSLRNSSMDQGSEKSNSNSKSFNMDSIPGICETFFGTMLNSERTIDYKLEQLHATHIYKYYFTEQQKVKLDEYVINNY